MKRVFYAAAICGTAAGVGAGVVFRTYLQPSMSMWPTLRVSERLLANRLAQQPERGAIVVFRYPERPDQSFVKRIIGLPGDVVSIAEGEVSINGWSIPRCSVGKTEVVDDGATGESAEKRRGTLFVESLGAARYLVFEEERPVKEPGDGNRWTVARGEYFVLGDNRNNSHDSRRWYGGAGGGVPFGNTQGRVRGHDVPELPSNVTGAASLSKGLAACLAERPGLTSPPAN